jgi:threonine/homoserine/homoserine lactone efflux protein
MPPRTPKSTYDRRLRDWLRRNRFFVSVIVFASGVFLTVLAAGDLTPLNTVQPFIGINAVTAAPNGANYNLAFVVIGPIVSIIGAVLVGGYLLARRRFEHLMKTKSKAEFLRNLDQIEEILWELTPTDEQRYLDKRAEFRLR